MADRIDFNKSLKDLNEKDIKARIAEDKLRLKKLETNYSHGSLLKQVL